MNISDDSLTHLEKMKEKNKQNDCILTHLENNTYVTNKVANKTDTSDVPLIWQISLQMFRQWEEADACGAIENT